MTTTETTTARYIAKCLNGHTVKCGSFSEFISGIYIMCPCGSRGIGRSMNITIKAEMECSGKCTNAQGPTCSCSCGGHNHGADHSL